MAGQKKGTRVWLLVIFNSMQSNLNLKLQFIETGIAGGQFKLGPESKQACVTFCAKLASTYTLLIPHSLRKKSERRRVSYQKLRLPTQIFVIQFLDSVSPFQKMACDCTRQNKSQFARRT